MPTWLAVAHRHQIARLLQPPAHRLRAGAGAAAEIAEAFLARRALIGAERAVDDDRGRGHAVVERGGIDDRLEGRARLAQRLGGAVEIGAAHVEAALHGEDPAGRHFLRHHPAGNLGDRAERPGVALPLDRDNRARAEARRKRSRRFRAGASRPSEAGIVPVLPSVKPSVMLPGSFDEHHGRPPRVVAGAERGDGEAAAPVAVDLDGEAGIAPAAAALVAGQAVAKRGLGGALHDRVVGAAHPQAPGIDAVRASRRVLAVAVDQGPADLLHEIAADIVGDLAAAPGRAERLARSRRRAGRR